jgi:hypothetical protein
VQEDHEATAVGMWWIVLRDADGHSFSTATARTHSRQFMGPQFSQRRHSF